MKTSEIMKETYCDGCRYFLARKCEILDIVTIEKKKQCNAAGYRSIKYSNSSKRFFTNRQGAKHDGDVR